MDDNGNTIQLDDIQDAVTIGGKKRAICYHCMYGDHKYCQGDSRSYSCVCGRVCGHDIRAARAMCGRDPDAFPPHFPEAPAATDNFYFA